jgi:hypothetical protein
MNEGAAEVLAETAMVAIGTKRTFVAPQHFVRYWMPAQPVDATQALNLSAGVSNCKVSRGRSLS